MNSTVKLMGASLLTLTLFAGAAMAQQSAPAGDARAGTAATMEGGLTIDELTARVTTGAEVDYGAIGPDARIMIVATRAWAAR
jgi:hypothetical protein